MMKVLIVTSGNNNTLSPFISDQVQALIKKGVEVAYFFIKGNGISGYLKNYRSLLRSINSVKPDLIHAHYGLTGLLAGLQRKIPVITTFHGSDVNVKRNRYFSRIAHVLSKNSIFVSQDLATKLNASNPQIIPCGVDLDVFYPIDKTMARTHFGLDQKKKYVLFSSSFTNTVKNYPLAKEAVAKLRNDNLELLELKGYKRDDVCLLMNAVDLVLMTSFSEGSPQFIKEAMACNTPIVSVDVGDVHALINNIKGCYIATFDPQDVSNKIQKALLDTETNARSTIDYLSNERIANQIITLYKDSVK